MKLVNYQLQTQIEYLSNDKPQEFFKDYIRSIIEDTSKPYYQRADYLGLSLKELQSKIDILASDIKELGQFKKRLAESLEIAKELTAEVFLNNGIDRIEGNIISSITLSKETTKEKISLEVKNTEELLKRGFVKYELDIEALQKAILQDKKLQKELKPFAEMIKTKETIPAKAKVNLKRSASNNTQTDELLHIAEAA